MVKLKAVAVKKAVATKKAVAKNPGVRPRPVVSKKRGTQAPRAATKVDVTATPAIPGVATVTTFPKDQLIRDSFTMPKAEYEVLAELKRRLLQRSKAVKKSELLRAGVAALAAMTDAKLLAAVERIPNLKTGRPKKDKAAKAPKNRD